MLARPAIARIASVTAALTCTAAAFTVGAAPAGASAGTSLTATISATGHLVRAFAWSLEKSVSPSTHTDIAEGTTVSPTWSVTATKTPAAAKALLDGQVCATNKGAVATAGLSIGLTLTRPGTKGVLGTASVPLGATTSLPAGGSGCWAYSIAAPAVPGATYKVTAAVRISNKASGKSNGANPSATASLPLTPDQTENESVTVQDSNGSSWTFNATGTRTYTTDYTCRDDEGVHENEAAFAGYATSPAPPPALATYTLDCADPADVVIRKTAQASSVGVGQAVGFDIEVTNDGASTAEDVAVVDVLPASPSGWNEDSVDCSIVAGTLICDFGDLAPGATAEVALSATAGPADCGSVTNTATVSATNEPVALQSDNSSTATVTVVCPELSLTKTADEPSISAGDTAGFTITATNDSAATATGLVLTDTLPAKDGLSWSISGGTWAQGCSIAAGVLSCSASTLAAGGSLAVHISSPTTAATCGTVSNTADLSAAGADSVSASDSIAVQCPQLGLTKVADDATVAAGDGLGFTITVTNEGAATAHDVGLSDTLPSSGDLQWTIDPAVAGCFITAGTLLCDFGDMGPSESVSVHLSGATEATCGTVSNTAWASATGSDPVSATAGIVVSCPTLALTKVADDPSVTAGAEIGFTIAIVNNGPGTAFDVVVSDSLPTSPGLSWVISPGVDGCSIAAGQLVCDFGDLPALATADVHISSPTTDATCGTVTNTASASALNADSPAPADDDIMVACASESSMYAVDTAATFPPGATSAGRRPARRRQQLAE